MFDPDSNWLMTAFALSNSARALFYVPQIVAVARSVDGARDIALSTWWMWTLNNALGGICSGELMGHTMLAVSFWASSAACLLTIALALRARRRLRRGAAMPDVAAVAPGLRP